MEHWVWVPTIACIALLAMIWLAGCTLTTGSSASSQPTASFTVPPRMTLTVFDPIQPAPTLAWRPAARTAVRPTAPPSPPPQTYIVQVDDTLLDIAIQFDVAFEALVAANPAIDPELLQIGQQLRIPSAPREAEIAISTLPAPSLALAAPNCYPTPTDGITCLGMVYNSNGQSLERVAVEVQLFGSGDLPLATGQATVEQATIPPEGVAPYRVTFPDVQPEQVEGVSVRLVAGTVASSAGQGAMLRLEDARLTQTGRSYTYRAQVVNVGDEVAAAPRVVVTLLDANEDVYGYRVWEGDAPLAPFARTSVRLNLLPVQQGTLPPLTARAYAEAPLASPPAP